MQGEYNSQDYDEMEYEAYAVEDQLAEMADKTQEGVVDDEDNILNPLVIEPTSKASNHVGAKVTFEDIVNLLKNPDHPAIKKGIDKIQNLMKDKFKKGSLKQDDIRNEIETIKAKITGFFGNSFNDILGLKKGETSREVLMGNSPEARRQRMLARLQKKVRDKNSH